MKSYVPAMFAIALNTTSVAAEMEIPRSVPGDKGRYFLLEMTKKGKIVETLHKRIGVDSVGYTRCEIDCKTRKIRDIGYSEVGPESITTDPTKWYDLVPGSSKNLVCKSG